MNVAGCVETLDRPSHLIAALLLPAMACRRLTEWLRCRISLSPNCSCFNLFHMSSVECEIFRLHLQDLILARRTFIMAAPGVEASAGAMPKPLSGDIAQLRAVCPTVVLPTDADYDTAKTAWNHDIVGRPSAIARPANATEVAGVVRWAVACGAPMCIASGRHSVYASRSDTLMLDLSRLTQLEVDPVARIADVGPGIKLGPFDAACAAHGLATTAGTNPDTGVAGLSECCVCPHHDHYRAQ